MWRCLVGAVLLTGCLSDPLYSCQDALQCVVGQRQGVCTAQGFCAYPDVMCESELRYSDLAGGALAGACVPAGSAADGGADDGSPATTGTSVGGDGCTPACDDPGPCGAPGSGECIDGSCVFDPQPAGTPCDEACEAAGFCDATGTCLCDTDVGTSSGGTEDCEMTCMAGPHVTSAACDAMGVCVLTCEAPWQDCDGDVATGCEVPVGVAYGCGPTGIDSDGCWTAYCGESMAANAHNFGTYHCLGCSTCQYPVAGECRWCDYDNGEWYPADPACECGEWLDLACTPA